MTIRELFNGGLLDLNIFVVLLGAVAFVLCLALLLYVLRSVIGFILCLFYKI
ncbi:MAG: hypothetical protein ACRC0V_10955 [Fusobacteriaceae bacterium]